MKDRIKKVLITQNSLKHFAGSEIVTLELATFFQQNNIDVTVFTWYYSTPIKTEFEKRKINVITDEDSPALNQNFDLVWVNHQVLPIEILRSINKTPQPFFVFYHMSYMDNLYIEQPYIYDLEKSLGSSSLFVSDEALQLNLKKYGRIFQKPTIFPNWSPDDFLDSVKTPPDTNKILVVSNHPPVELEEATHLLERSGFTVDYIGHSKKKYDLVTPDLLKQYSCIISIGKTVQYCLTLNIPVYIYDHFGGCGFLNAKNYKTAEAHNFSGRGFNKKPPENIAKEITGNLNEARSFQTENLNKFKDNFSLKNNFQKLLSSLPKQRKNIKLDETYLNYVIAAENITKQMIVTENEHRILLEKFVSVESLNNAIDNLKQENQNLKNIIQSMENSRIIKLDKKIRNLIHRTPKDRQEKYQKQYKTHFIRKPQHLKENVKIIGMVREKNESLILDDTLSELEKIVDGFILLDDNSSDDSIQIAKKHPKCLAIIKNTKTKTGDRSWEESIHRELLLDLAKKYNPDWIFYQDADERVESPKKVRKFMLENTKNPSVSAVSFSFFDAYMTKNDFKPYKSGPLFNFRKMFGPERRDIVMAWKNTPSATFLACPDLRVPVGLDGSKIITKFHVQHYGKSLSVDHWEETCDYYVKHFPQYAEKWQARKGKGIHNNNKSDFNRPLMTWSEVKKDGGVKID